MQDPPWLQSRYATAAWWCGPWEGGRLTGNPDLGRTEAEAMAVATVGNQMES